MIRSFCGSWEINIAARSLRFRRSNCNRYPRGCAALRADLRMDPFSRPSRRRRSDKIASGVRAAASLHPRFPDGPLGAPQDAIPLVEWNKSRACLILRQTVRRVRAFHIVQAFGRFLPLIIAVSRFSR